MGGRAWFVDSAPDAAGTRAGALKDGLALELERMATSSPKNGSFFGFICHHSSAILNFGIRFTFYKELLRLLYKMH